MNNSDSVLDHEPEGVIKYQLEFHQQVLPNKFVSSYLSNVKLNKKVEALNASRQLLKDKGLIGQDSLRYGGDGFGNISVRAEGLRF